MIHVHKPKFIWCESIEDVNSKVKDPCKANTLLAHVCEIQRKGGRRFVATMSIQAPMWVYGAWKETKDKAEVRHVGVHPAKAKGVQVITNSAPVVDALLEGSVDHEKCRHRQPACPRDPCNRLEEVVEKGVEVDLLASLSTKFFTLRDSPPAQAGARPRMLFL